MKNTFRIKKLNRLKSLFVLKLARKKFFQDRNTGSRNIYKTVGNLVLGIKLFPTFSRVRQICAQNRLQINRQSVGPNHQLQAHDTISIILREILL